jgi:hypothetical protein
MKVIAKKIIFLITVFAGFIPAACFAVTNVNDFIDGINVVNFQQCETKVTTTCGFAQDYNQYKQCMKQMPVFAQCKQFNTFAQLIDFGFGYHVDFIDSYNDRSIWLIHVVMKGANFPGDYYFVTRQGQFIKATDPNAVDVTQNADFIKLQAHFPQAGLWALVDKLPTVQQLKNGNFLFTFQFPLLNGCHACERAGYANIGYEFLYNGQFKEAKLISIVSNAPTTMSPS